jgi:hypothetical protein
MTHHRILVAVLACASLSLLQAQQLRINAFGGYTFQDRFPIYGSYAGYSFSEGRVAAGAHYGGGLEYELRPNTAVELFYQAQPSEGFLRTSFVEYGPYDITVHYVMLGGLHYLPFSKVVHGYGGLNMGCGFSTGEGNSTKFAWGGKLGLRIDASDKVGVKLGAQLLSPVDQVGGGLYFGTGGVSAGVSTYSTVYQFGLTGGLVFTL